KSMEPGALTIDAKVHALNNVLVNALKIGKDYCRELYPEIEPYSSGFLEVSDLHSLYWEQSGNPNGHSSEDSSGRKDKDARAKRVVSGAHHRGSRMVRRVVMKKKCDSESLLTVAVRELRNLKARYAALEREPTSSREMNMDIGIKNST
ncbi:hypothetical protein KI387_023022, partial [Taxus chinensis]